LFWSRPWLPLLHKCRTRIRRKEMCTEFLYETFLENCHLQNWEGDGRIRIRWILGRSISCPVAGFGVIDVEPSCFSTRVIVNELFLYKNRSYITAQCEKKKRIIWVGTDSAIPRNIHTIRSLFLILDGL
jgi:hypothetical protein